MAIALAIIALLSAGAITALQAQNTRNRLLETRAQLSEAREALINFAAVTGALPCPDTNNDGDPDACPGTVTRGRLPWRMLGLPSTDVWGQALHYAVHFDFTDAPNLRLSSGSTLGIESQDAAGAFTDLANPANVALALWSSGADATPNPNGSTANNILAEAPNSDDVVIWLSRFVLLGRMLEAGRDIPQ